MSRLSKYLFGSTKTNELDAATVDALIDGATPEHVPEDLFTFGKLLMATTDERVAAIDSKSTAVVGFSGAILAFIVTRLFETTTLPQRITLALVGISAAVACVYAGRALKGSKDWRGFSETTWFPNSEILTSSDKLKRFWLKAMHGMHQHNYRIANEKADLMVKAQLLIAVAAFLLALTLVAGMMEKSVSVPSEISSTSHADSESSRVALYSTFHADQLGRELSWCLLQVESIPMCPACR